MRRCQVGILALAMLASACTIPTESPNWDMTWNVPVPDKGKMSIGVASFLPSGVTTIGTPPTAFRANLGGAGTASITRTLGADCTTCPNGTAPKPSYTAAPPAATVSLAAAASLTSATLAAGSQIVFTINNGFNFDPVRPQAGSATTGTGVMTLTVNNGGNNLGILTILGSTPGAAGAIPPGPSTFTLPLAGTITGSSPISVTMTLTSPAGSTVAMNPSQIFAIVGTPTINISSATVSIAAQAITTPGDTVDLSGVDSSIVRRVQNDALTRGTMFLTLTNPFTVGGAMTVRFSSPPGTAASKTITPITKNVTLNAAANGTTPNVSTVAINFTGIELRSILSHVLLISFGGNTAAGPLTVTPTQKISVTSRMQLNFTIKEQP